GDAHQPLLVSVQSLHVKLLARSDSPQRGCQNRRAVERKENAHMAQEAIPLEKVATHTKQTSRALRAQHLAPYLFLLPFLVLFSLFFILPIIYAISQSL